MSNTISILLLPGGGVPEGGGGFRGLGSGTAGKQGQRHGCRQNCS